MTPLFRDALAALDSGDVAVLERLLADHPEVLRERPEFGEGYFRRPYLLWFVAENPVRNGRLPDKIAAVTRVILAALLRRRGDDLALQLDTALALVCSGRVPRECGVQQELIDALAAAGADLGRALEPALAHRERAAADRLLELGAPLTLLAAACRGEIHDVDRLARGASARELQRAVIGAALHGQAAALATLLRHGPDLDGYGPAGFHPHATALHQAVYSGDLEAVRTLVEAGASLTLKDSIYDGTPLDWAEHGQHAAIADYLRAQAAGARSAWGLRLASLFLKPSEFFKDRSALVRRPRLLIAIAFMGLAGGIDRIDWRFAQEDIGIGTGRRGALTAMVGSWPRFWAYAGVLGFLMAAFGWWIGGWWCKVRLRWSGAPDPDPALARALLVNASLVWSVPAVLSMAAQTAIYPSYPEAYERGWALTAAVVVTYLWSCVTLYKGAVRLFPVRRLLAASWFVALPIAVLLVVFVVSMIASVLAVPS